MNQNMASNYALFVYVTFIFKAEDLFSLWCIPAESNPDYIANFH